MTNSRWYHAIGASDLGFMAAIAMAWLHGLHLEQELGWTVLIKVMCCAPSKQTLYVPLDPEETNMALCMQPEHMVACFMLCHVQQSQLAKVL